MVDLWLTHSWLTVEQHFTEVRPTLDTNLPLTPTLSSLDPSLAYLTPERDTHLTQIWPTFDPHLTHLTFDPYLTHFWPTLDPSLTHPRPILVRSWQILDQPLTSSWPEVDQTLYIYIFKYVSKFGPHDRILTHCRQIVANMIDPQLTQTWPTFDPHLTHTWPALDPTVDPRVANS